MFDRLMFQKQMEHFRKIYKKTLNHTHYMKATNQDITIASFVQKAYDIVNNHQYSRYIQWLPNGKQFIIKDIEEFQQCILPQFFRHRNINSFIRQLNMYGFHKSRKQPTKNIFSHPYFQRDKEELLIHVKRKIRQEQTPTPKKNIPNHSSSADLPTSTTKNHKKDDVLHPGNPLEQEVESNIQKHRERTSPLKGLICGSFIFDMSSEVCRGINNGLVNQDHEDSEDNLLLRDAQRLSIDEDIEPQENQRFQNRQNGISIVHTSNFLDDFIL